MNVSGSLLLGVLIGLNMRGDLATGLLTILGTGFCGAYTTFSTFTVATVRLAEEGDYRAAAANVAASFVVTTAAAAFGIMLVAC